MQSSFVTRQIMKNDRFYFFTHNSTILQTKTKIKIFCSAIKPLYILYLVKLTGFDIFGFKMNVVMNEILKILSAKVYNFVVYYIETV